MGWFLFLLFTVVPIAEILLIVELAPLVGGFWGTVAIVLLTGIVGARLARLQGLGVVQRIQRSAAEGRMPARELLDGAMILVAGVLLIAPGYLTDVTGILLLLPPVRAALRGVLGAWATRHLKLHVQSRFYGARGAGPGAQDPTGGGWTRRGDDDAPDIIPPDRAPRPPKPKRPKVITVED